MSFGNIKPILFMARGHTGTRAFAEFLEKCGVYMGSKDNLNISYDSIPFTFRFQRSLLLNFLNNNIDLNRVRKVGKACTEKHLRKYKRGRWGFKTCDAMFSHPMYNILFPNAKYIEIVRDGRDAILSRNGKMHLSHTRDSVRKKHWEYFKIVTFGYGNDGSKYDFLLMIQPELIFYIKIDIEYKQNLIYNIGCKLKN